MRIIHSLIVAAVVIAGISSAHGEATLEGVRLGTFGGGPGVTVADLKGRVVLFEYWGVNCGPCLANIPHLTELQKKYPREQFIVVANHCQGGGAANAAAVWAARSHDASVVSVIDGGNLPGSNVSGIPHCFLFDSNGKLIYDGHPAKVDAKVDEAVKASPGFLVAGHDFKVMTREAAAIGAMRGNLSGTIKRLRAAAADEKNPGHDDAAYLMQRLTEWSEAQYAACSKQPSDDPLAAMTTTQKMIGLLRGDELGDRWMELEKTRRQDKTFQNEVTAAKFLAMLEQQAQKGPLFSDAKVGESRLAAEKANLKAQLQELARRYPDTGAAKKAGDYITAWKL